MLAILVVAVVVVVVVVVSAREDRKNKGNPFTADRFNRCRAPGLLVPVTTATRSVDGQDRTVLQYNHTFDIPTDLPPTYFCAHAIR